MGRMFIGGNRFFNESRFAGRPIYSPKAKAAKVIKATAQPIAKTAQPKPAQAAADQQQSTEQIVIKNTRLGVLAFSLLMLFLK